jgi:hypothetical protein
VTGVVDPPPGELVIVFRRPGRVWDLIRRTPPPVAAEAPATRVAS